MFDITEGPRAGIIIPVAILGSDSLYFLSPQPKLYLSLSPSQSSLKFMKRQRSDNASDESRDHGAQSSRGDGAQSGRGHSGGHAADDSNPSITPTAAKGSAVNAAIEADGTRHRLAAALNRHTDAAIEADGIRHRLAVSLSHQSDAVESMATLYAVMQKQQQQRWDLQMQHLQALQVQSQQHQNQMQALMEEGAAACRRAAIAAAPYKAVPGAKGPPPGTPLGVTAPVQAVVELRAPHLRVPPVPPMPPLRVKLEADPKPPQP